jgi:hypothetical protein
LKRLTVVAVLVRESLVRRDRQRRGQGCLGGRKPRRAIFAEEASAEILIAMRHLDHRVDVCWIEGDGGCKQIARSPEVRRRAPDMRARHALEIEIHRMGIRLARRAARLH